MILRNQQNNRTWFSPSPTKWNKTQGKRLKWWLKSRKLVGNKTGTKGKQDVKLGFQSALKFEFVIFMWRLNKHDFKLNSEHQQTSLAQTLSLHGCVFLGKKNHPETQEIPRRQFTALFFEKAESPAGRAQWGHAKTLHPRVWLQGSTKGLFLCFPPLSIPENSHNTNSQQLCNNSRALEADLAPKGCYK